MSLIYCKNLCIGYEHGTVAENIDFSVEPGDYVCIIGENGVGKSTLLKTLLGLLKPTGGELLFGDGLIPTEIGYLPQQKPAQKDFPATVYEIVISGALGRLKLLPFFSKKDRHLANHNMEALGISDLKKKSYRKLSGGQQQKVLLARALCATKKLLILDEPTAGLDPESSANMYKIIKGLSKQGIAVVTVTHDIFTGTRDADKILYIAPGKTHYYSADEFKSSPLYLKLTGGDGI